MRLKSRWDLAPNRQLCKMAQAIYWLKPSISEAQRMRYAPDMRFQTEVCEGNPDHAKRHKRPSLLKLIYTGGITTDFMWTHFSEVIPTSRVAEAFRSAKVSGCKFVPVDLENTLGEPIGIDRLEMRVMGWGETLPRKMESA